MKEDKMLERAIAIAMDAHKAQVDKFGAPYIGHLNRVMDLGETLEEKIVGMLHDLVEDTHWTFEDLAKEGFPNQIIEALKCVTKKDDGENYDDFISRIEGNPLAVKVKLNDLTDNLDVKRMPEVLEKDLPRINKYLKAYKYLKQLI